MEVNNTSSAIKDFFADGSKVIYDGSQKISMSVFDEMVAKMGTAEQTMYEDVKKKYEGESKILDALYEVLDTEWASDEDDKDKKNDQYSYMGDMTQMTEYYFAMMQRNMTDIMKKISDMADAGIPSAK